MRMPSMYLKIEEITTGLSGLFRCKSLVAVVTDPFGFSNQSLGYMLPIKITEIGRVFPKVILFNFDFSGSLFRAKRLLERL